MEKPGISRGHRHFGCFRFDIDAVNPDYCIAILDSKHILLNSDEVPSFCCVARHDERIMAIYSAGTT